MPTTRERIAADKAAAEQRKARGDKLEKLEKRSAALSTSVEELKAQNAELSSAVQELQQRVTALEPVKPARTTKTAK